MAAGTDVRLVDFHTHTQPSEAAGRAFVARLGLAGHPLTGALDELLARMGPAGVARTMIVPWLPARDLVDEAVARGEDHDAAVASVLASWSELNGWATSAVRRHPDRLACLVGVDPVLMSPGELTAEVATRMAEGASGIKIAPMFVGVGPDDPAMEIVWRTAAELGTFVLSQSGARGYGPHEAWGHPARFEEVLRSYPGVPVVLAHLGLGAEEDVVGLAGAHPNLYADLSLRLGSPGPGPWSADSTAILIRRIGVDRVLFGTNYPMVDPAAYVVALRSLGLTEEEYHAVGWGNAGRLLALRPPPS